MAFYIIISLHILCQVFLHIHKAAYFFHYKDQILSMRKCRHHSHRASVLPQKGFFRNRKECFFRKNTSGKCRCRCVLHIIFLQNARCKRNVLPLQAVINRKPLFHRRQSQIPPVPLPVFPKMPVRSADQTAGT